MKRLSLIALCFLTGCGRYADFALPTPQTAGPAGPFHWEATATPVLARGDAVDVLNPSVVRFRDSYWNLYSEYDGKSWHTAAATSTDGITWTKQGRIISRWQRLHRSERLRPSSRRRNLLLVRNRLPSATRARKIPRRQTVEPRRHRLQTRPLPQLRRTRRGRPLCHPLWRLFLSLLPRPRPRRAPAPGRRPLTRRRHVGTPAHEPDSGRRSPRNLRRRTRRAQPYGNPADGGGCSTQAAPATNSDAWV